MQKSKKITKLNAKNTRSPMMGGSTGGQMFGTNIAKKGRKINKGLGRKRYSGEGQSSRDGGITTTLGSSEGVKLAFHQELSGRETTYFNIESDSDDSVCSEPIAYIRECLENSDMCFNEEIFMNRKEGRVRTQSFECPHDFPLETRGQMDQISNIDLASLGNSGESISDNNSDLFETISEYSIESFNKKFTNTLNL